MTRYKIHPAIGVARVGNSENSFYFSPERADALPTEIVGGHERPIEKFRDAEGRLRRAACRFRIYAYDGDDPSEAGRLVTVGESGVAEIEWSVYLANKKPIWYQFDQLEGEHGYGPDHKLRNPQVKDPEMRKKLMIDPGPQTICGPNARGEFARGKGPKGYPQSFPPKGLFPFGVDTLGEIRTDEASTLMVLGGLGSSGTTERTPKIENYANNDHWWDDVSDGPVRATLVMEDGSRIEVDTPAWVVVGLPSFAPEIPNVITLYDAIYDVAVQKLGYRPDIFRNGKYNLSYEPSFDSEIGLILGRPRTIRWVMETMPQFAHLFDFKALSNPDAKFAAERRDLFSILRPPDAPNESKQEQTGRWLMPLLAGDNPITQDLVSKYLVVTPTQYFLLSQWAKGSFRAGKTNEPERPGKELDRAMLENCTGGAFCPGMELGWIVRNPKIYSEPFRIKHRKLSGQGLSLGEDLDEGLEPGDLTKRMALPWQADFFECSVQQIGTTDVVWWPSQRPRVVYDESLEKVSWTRGFPPDNETGYAGDLQMVTNWKDLGFIKNVGSEEEPNFMEIERNSGAIPPPEET